MVDDKGIKQEEPSNSMTSSVPPLPVKTEEETIVPPVASSSDCDSAATTVTNIEQRNSPSNVTSQEYQQQLHEAIMAFDSHGLSQNLMAAMAAAVGVSSPSTLQQQQPTPHHQTQQTEQHQQLQQPRKDIDFAKRESIRVANRERKKKWRIHNEERNKDNDLRCRVNKRASKLFGTEDSEGKRLWAEDEFRKRREKRQEKERRKDVVNNVLSAPQTSSTTTTPLPSSNSMLSQQAAAIDDLAQSFAAYPSVFDASKLLEIPSDLQRHLLEQLNLALTNSKLPTSIDYGQPSNDMTGSQSLTDPSNLHTSSDPSHNSAAEAAAAAAAELLAATATATTISEPLISAPTSSPPPSLVQSSLSTAMELDKPTISPNAEMEKDDANSSDSSYHSLESNAVTTNEDAEGEGQDTKDKKQDYPMDAVLTLMQLNAGWKK